MLFRYLLFLSVLTLAGASPDAVVGREHAQIRLTDGRVLTHVKILGCSPSNNVSVVQQNELRTIPLDRFPEPLRQQIFTEGEAHRRAYARYERYAYPSDARTVPPPQLPESNPSPAAVTSTGTATDRLVEQAMKEAPDELKFHLLKTFERVSSLTVKVRKAEQVPGWQKIRVTGDAAFSFWEQSRRDYVWRADKFEVEFAIEDGRTLKLASISFGGISRTADPEGNL